jgi:hypothetical protein
MDPTQKFKVMASAIKVLILVFTLYRVLKQRKDQTNE